MEHLVKHHQIIPQPQEVGHVYAYTCELLDNFAYPWWNGVILNQTSEFAIETRLLTNFSVIRELKLVWLSTETLSP